MDILSAIILGIIQGAAEFLPISSSAHLSLAHSFFGIVDPGRYPAFDVLLHAGTLTAVIIACRRELLSVLSGAASLFGRLFKKKPLTDALSDNERLFIFTVLSSIPTVLFVLLGGDKLSDAVGSSPAATGALLILNGFILLSIHKKSGKKTYGDIKPAHALGVGLCQAVAVMPGISRSGATTAGGILLGYKCECAVKMSFLMSLPAVFGACILKIPAIVSSAPGKEELAVYGIGYITAAVTGLCAVKLIDLISKKSSFGYFSVYCFALGIFAMIKGSL